LDLLVMRGDWRWLLTLGAGSLCLAIAHADEAALWQQISTPPATKRINGVDGFADRANRLQSRLDLIQQYHTLYPGGTHRADCIAIELECRYRLALLKNQGKLDQLSTRVEALLQRDPAPAVEHEAAYWKLICDDNRPADKPHESFPDFSQARSAAREAYIRQYPSSRHTPRLLSHLFSTAVRNQRWDVATRLAQWSSEQLPDSGINKRIQAKLRLHSTTGQPFPHNLNAPPEAQAVFRTVKDQDHLIVVWASFDETSCTTARDIALWQRSRPRITVIGVNLDSAKSSLLSATKRMNLSWPQIHDGAGWDTWFATTWDIRELPQVFAVDRSGRLLGSAGAENWRPLAERLAAAGPRAN
jgi:hypothetical protein